MDKIINTLKHGKSIPILLVLEKTNGPLRFLELGDVLNINHRNLSITLKLLTENKLIRCVRHKEVPPKVEYSLTDKGKLLAEVLHNII